MKSSFHKSSILPVMLMVMLLTLVAMVCVVNFLAPPGFYDSDMYTDIRYAMEAWKHKSVFPEGWVFGNQLYVLSTPVLAALFYGLTGEPGLAMAMSSTVMTVLVLLSFVWMLQPAIQNREARMAGLVLFMALTLFFGDAWHDPTGWQLLFTMCSYYACYAMTVFLAYGCWLRSEKLGEKGYGILLSVACIYAFGTGIQSLRQTAVMTLPLLGGEILKVFWRRWKRLEFDRKSFAVTVLISFANLAGLVMARCLELEQVEIIGQLDLLPPAQWFGNLRQGVLLAISLIMNHDIVGFGILAVLMAAGVWGTIRLIRAAVRSRGGKSFLLLMVLLFSVLAILAVDTLSTMLVRSIYYFMLYPLLAFLAAWLYGHGSKWERYAVSGLVLAVFLLSSVREIGSVLPRIRDTGEESAYEISEYLQTEGYSTLYGGWNQGADVVIASDWNLQAGFWEYPEDPYFFYKYLCNPQVFHADPEKSAYLFYGQDAALRGVEQAGTKGIEMNLLKYFPDCDAYLYEASENIMEAFW